MNIFFPSFFLLMFFCNFFKWVKRLIWLIGPWRWFDDSMLDCCEPLEKIKVQGITFGKVACLARCNGAKVKAFRSDQSTVEDFRNQVILCCKSEDCHVIVSYWRTLLNQVC